MTALRETDIRPADIHAEYLRLSAADAERLFADRSVFAHRSCPGCGVDRPVRAFDKNGFELARCGECETLYVDPCPTAAQLAPLYADSPSTRYWAEVFFPTVAEPRRARIFRPRVERIIALMERERRPLDSVVEVGAGAAVFLEELRKARPTLSIRAVEPGRALAAQCRDKGFATFEGFVESLGDMPGWAGSADLVVCFEVIEHTPDPLAFVTALAALAKPNGTVLMSGLCGDGFDIRTLGARSNAVSPPHHVTFLSRRGAAALLGRAGLVQAEVFTPGELDVDIVLNALKYDRTAVADPFLRALLLGPDDAARAAFQAFLKEHGLSSHMWATGRRPGP